MLGRYDRAMRARQPVGGQTLLARAIAAIKRNNGTLFYVPQNFSGAWTDSAGTDTVDAVADVIGRMTDRTGGSAVATQATTANKPTVQINAQGRYVMRFDGANDFLQTGITTGNEGWVCAGVAPSAITGYRTIAHTGVLGSAKGVWLLSDLGRWVMSTFNGSTNQLTAYIDATTSPTVVSGGWNVSTVLLEVNGQSVSAARTGDCVGTTPLRIGITSADSYPLSGDMTAIVICPILPSAADRALIRKWIGSLQGQTL